MSLPSRRFPSTSVLLLALVLAPGIIGAQTSAVVDEGTFMVTQNGTSIGRESFRILRSPGPGGQVYEARSRSALGRVRISTTLATDSAGVPVSYYTEVSHGTTLSERLQGRGRPGRFSVLVQTKSGEAAREYVLDNGALVLDDDVIYQYFFLGVAPSQAQYNVIGPRTQQQAKFTYEDRGSDVVDVGGRRVSSRRFALTSADGSARELWLDAGGRLLKVAIPDRSIVATRDDPPR